MEQKALNDKGMLMESQLNTLESNEFTKTVLCTLQTSAKAMQRMGLNKDLLKTDQVISELEEGMTYAHDVNNALGTNLSVDYTLDDSALDYELNAILGIETIRPEDTATAAVVSTVPEANAPETAQEDPDTAPDKDQENTAQENTDTAPEVNNTMAT